VRGGPSGLVKQVRSASWVLSAETLGSLGPYHAADSHAMAWCRVCSHCLESLGARPGHAVAVWPPGLAQWPGRVGHVWQRKLGLLDGFGPLREDDFQSIFLMPKTI
jgi:hypothetical protein